MLNILGREGLDNPFQGAFAKQKKSSYTVTKRVTPVFGKSFDEVLDALHLRNGMTISFHHHLRNGDFVLNMVMEILLVCPNTLNRKHEMFLNYQNREVLQTANKILTVNMKCF